MKNYFWLCPCTLPHGVVRRAAAGLLGGHHLPSRCKTSHCTLPIVMLREIPAGEPSPPHATNRRKSGFRQIRWDLP